MVSEKRQVQLIASNLVLVNIILTNQSNKTMGNRTNSENWAAQERLRAIERAAWWRGWVKRKDLAALFGVSMAQASSDLQKYQELNPGALVYQMQRKRYEGSESMSCVLHEPRLDEGISSFLGGATSMGIAIPSQDGSNLAAGINLPLRKGKLEIERAVMLALVAGNKLRIKHWGVSSGKTSLRWIAPLAFGHDGYRWHVRAWCFKRKDFRDFTLSRIEKAEWPQEMESNEVVPDDSDWNEMVEIKVRAHRDLSESARRAIEMDYGMRKNGVLRIPVRKAMEGYLRDHLRIARDGGDLPVHFETAEGSR